jgi:hypothetical protein
MCLERSWALSVDGGVKSVKNRRFEKFGILFSESKKPPLEGAVLRRRD